MLACGGARNCLLDEAMLSVVSRHPPNSAGLGTLTVREAEGDASSR